MIFNDFTIYWCWYIMSCCDLDLWPHDLESQSYIGCHMVIVCCIFFNQN